MDQHKDSTKWVKQKSAAMLEVKLPKTIKLRISYQLDIQP